MGYEPDDTPRPWPVFFVGLFIFILCLLGIFTPFGSTSTVGGFPVRGLSLLLLIGVAYLWFLAARAVMRRRK
jgi:hypothetical protein